MRLLGAHLGERLAARLATPELLIVCTVEDADFLAAGVLDALPPAQKTHLVCFWNQRQTLAGEKIAPIIKRYVEPFESARVRQIVVLKSIISSGCVVRTNLLELLETTQPEEIFVAAPVFYSQSRQALESEFPAHVSDRFKYVTLAIDDEIDGAIIRPGIGGDVYSLLGFEGQEQKNRYTPHLIQEREARLWRAASRG